MDNSINFSDNFDYMFLDAQSILNGQEIANIARDIRKVIYKKAVAQKIFPTVQIGRGKREHKISKAIAPSAPRFTQDFTDESLDKVAKKETTYKLIGLEKDYFLSMVDIDASHNSQYHKDKIDTLHLREMVALIADFRERTHWRGYDIKGADPGALDTDVLGIFNDSDVQSFSAGIGADSKTGAIGDFVASIGTASDKLLAEGHYPPYVLVLSSDEFAQMILNMNTTTDKTEIALVNEMIADSGEKLIKNIFISDHLVKDDPDRTGATVGAMALIAPKNNAGEWNVEIVESYPLWHYPTRVNRLGIGGKVLTMCRAVVHDGTAIAVDSSIDPDGTT